MDEPIRPRTLADDVREEAERRGDAPGPHTCICWGTVSCPKCGPTEYMPQTPSLSQKEERRLRADERAELEQLRAWRRSVVQDLPGSGD